MPIKDHQPSVEPADRQLHRAVLTTEVLQVLEPRPAESYLDVTAGYGGHASLVLKRTEAHDKAVLVDRDRGASEYLRAKFADADVRQGDYVSVSHDLISQGRRFELILADLGVSSPQLDSAVRGFSLQREGPLDMRLDQTQTLTAAQIVNAWPKERIAGVLAELGQEPRAGRIAELIAAHRPIRTTTELAAIVELVWPRGRRHPATRIFQALRIAVNDELGQLERALPLWLQLLAPGGRMAIISFHSLEDRLVKQFLVEHSGQPFDAQLRLLTKKPLRPTATEIANNPRTRSARLRAAAKLKQT